MAADYRVFQHWNNWLNHHYLGHALLGAEQKCMQSLLAQKFGKHALLIGVSQQEPLLHATNVSCHTILSPLLPKEELSGYVEGDFQELPILTGSVDLVLLPHVLEMANHPRQILSEACRVIKPEGLIVITGFNPYSLWGMIKFLKKSHALPKNISLIAASEITRWLQLADFEMEICQTFLYRPPLASVQSFERLRFIEKIAGKVFPKNGAAYIVVARAKVIPLTPIRLKWKQHLSNMNVGTSISGHIAR